MNPALETSLRLLSLTGMTHNCEDLECPLQNVCRFITEQLTPELEQKYKLVGQIDDGTTICEILKSHFHPPMEDCST